MEYENYVYTPYFLQDYSFLMNLPLRKVHCIHVFTFLGINIKGATYFRYLCKRYSSLELTKRIF
jgi:hypothetical protein